MLAVIPVPSKRGPGPPDRHLNRDAEVSFGSERALPLPSVR
jgi:hypothetical protein